MYSNTAHPALERCYVEWGVERRVIKSKFWRTPYLRLVQPPIPLKCLAASPNILPWIFLSVNTVNPSFNQKCSKFLFVTRLPDQLWAISWAMTPAKLLSPDCRKSKQKVKNHWTQKMTSPLQPNPSILQWLKSAGEEDQPLPAGFYVRWTRWTLRSAKSVRSYCSWPSFPSSCEQFRGLWRQPKTYLRSIVKLWLGTSWLSTRKIQLCIIKNPFDSRKCMCFGLVLSEICPHLKW